MNCPACRAKTAERLVETHVDRILGRSYRLYLCDACEAGFSEPRDPVGSEWYARAHIGEAVARRRDWRYETFLAQDLSRGRLLDLGCGAGTFLQLARAAGWRVWGLDYNPEHVRAAREAGLENVSAQGYREFLDRTAATYDVVTLFDVLEHVPEPADLLERIHRALSPGGRLALTLPNAERPLPSAAFREEWDYPPYHYTRWSAKSAGAVLKRAGFIVEEVRYSPLPFGFLSGVLYYALLNALFPALKRRLLGARGEEERKTWTDLLSQSPASAGPFRRLLAWTGLRRGLTEAGYRAAFLLLLPLEVPLVLALRLLAPRRSPTFFILARRAEG